MSSPFGPIVLVANPAAGRGAVGARLPEISSTLRSMGLEHRTILTEAPGDATRAAAEALRRGESFVVAVGGDGTVHEVVNGMVDEERPPGPTPVLGVVPAGSGCDFVQTFGLPADALRACRHLQGDNVYPIDLGKVSYRDDEGRPAVRYFANIAEAGLGASVVARSARLPRWVGRSRYFFGFWLTLPRFRPARVRLQGTDRAMEVEAHQVVVANCQYYGGGMRISPRSWPGDGILDVLVMTGPKSEAFTLLPKVYRGEHLPHRHITELKVRRLVVEAEGPWRVEADGEALGWTPATFEVVRLPIRLKV